MRVRLERLQRRRDDLHAEHRVEERQVREARTLAEDEAALAEVRVEEVELRP